MQSTHPTAPQPKCMKYFEWTACNYDQTQAVDILHLSSTIQGYLNENSMSLSIVKPLSILTATIHVKEKLWFRFLKFFRRDTFFMALGFRSPLITSPNAPWPNGLSFINSTSSLCSSHWSSTYNMYGCTYMYNYNMYKCKNVVAPNINQ